jgi:hypothetical protein
MRHRGKSHEKAALFDALDAAVILCLASFSTGPNRTGGTTFCTTSQNLCHQQYVLHTFFRLAAPIPNGIRHLFQRSNPAAPFSEFSQNGGL